MKKKSRWNTYNKDVYVEVDGRGSIKRYNEKWQTQINH